MDGEEGRGQPVSHWRVFGAELHVQSVALSCLDDVRRAGRVDVLGSLTAEAIRARHFSVTFDLLCSWGPCRLCPADSAYSTLHLQACEKVLRLTASQMHGDCLGSQLVDRARLTGDYVVSYGAQAKSLAIVQLPIQLPELSIVRQTHPI
jgi:hypothetical protein